VGQKVHPYGFRLGVTKTWRSRWFAKQDYAKLLKEDLDLKASLLERLKAAGVSSIEVDRPGNKLRVTIRTSRPGIIIGRKGAEIEKLKTDLAKKTKREVFIDISEVHKPELDAQLVAESIALQLEKRVAFRRAMRKAVDSALRFGCKGIKVRVSGRLNGAEIARSEWYLQGQLPLHTLRADLDYGFAQAYTTYGVIGVKVWTYKGEIIEGGRRTSLKNESEPRSRGPRDRDRDRGGDRDRRDRPDRGERRGPPPIHAAPPAADAPSHTGPATQAAPGELPHLGGRTAPILPPLAPPQPSWKQEAREAPAVEAPKPAAEAAKPAVEALKPDAHKPEGQPLDAPKAEPPKAGPPVAEPPKAEAPVTEPPKAEAPRAEPPKPEAPVSEPPAKDETQG
jgi:small subunit ribosomal protein S3